MTSRKRKDIRKGIVRILHANGGSATGTGFFLDKKRLIVTCLHVVDAAAAYPKTSFREPVPVHVLASDSVVKCPVYETDIALDIALLQWPNDLDVDHEVEVFRLGESDIALGQLCQTFGFPEDKEIDGTPGLLEVLSQKTTERGMPVVSFRSTEVTKGFSGAPVWHRDTDCVVGVITSFLLPDESGRGVETGYFVPSEALYRRRSYVGIATRQSMMMDAWARWTQRELTRRYGEERGRADLLVTPALQEEWEYFLSKEKWHQRIKIQAQKCLLLCQRLVDDQSSQLRAIRDIEKGMSEINFTVQYHVIKSQLEALFKKRPLSIVSRIKRQTIAHRESVILGKLKGELWTLQKNFEESFEKCFLVLGGLGEGRTHFLWSLLLASYRELASAEEIGKRCIYLPLDLTRRTRTSISKAIMEELKAASGQFFHDFDSFLYALSELLPDTILVIAFDDFDNWIDFRSDHQAELTELVANSTQHHNLLWLVSVNHARYPMVGEKSSFWCQYGNNSSLGWHVLDEANRKRETGINMIRKYWSKYDSDDKEVNRLRLIENRGDVLRHLCSPFVARVAIDVRARPDQLIDLRFVEFVREFLGRRMDSMDTSQVCAVKDSALGLMKQAMYGIAVALSKTGDFHPEFSELSRMIYDSGDWRSSMELVTRCLKVLHDGALIQIISSEGNEGIFDIIPDKKEINIRYPMVWEYLIANRLLDALADADNSGEVIELLTAWIESAQGEKNVEGVLVYLIMRVDLERSKYPAVWGAIERMIAVAMTTGGVVTSAVLLTAPKASKEYRLALIESRYGGLSIEAAQGDVCFDLLYFVGELPSSEIALWDRIRLIQPYYEIIGKQSLAAYFLYLVETHVTTHTENSVIAKSLPYFSGCELTGVSRETAGKIVERLIENACLVRLTREVTSKQKQKTQEATKGLLSLATEYLAGITEERARSGYEQVGDSEEWERDLFRNWFLNDLLHELVIINGVDMYLLLDEMAWYRGAESGICKTVQVEMAKAANFALADYYKRHANDENKLEYVSMVNELARNGDANDREIAFFLIIHTVATGRRRKVNVDTVFHDALKSIWEGREPQWILQCYEQMFRINLGLGADTTSSS